MRDLRALGKLRALPGDVHTIYVWHRPATGHPRVQIKVRHAGDRDDSAVIDVHADDDHELVRAANASHAILPGALTVLRVIHGYPPIIEEQWQRHSTRGEQRWETVNAAATVAVRAYYHRITTTALTGRAL